MSLEMLGYFIVTGSCMGLKQTFVVVARNQPLYFSILSHHTPILHQFPNSTSSPLRCLFMKKLPLTTNEHVRIGANRYHFSLQASLICTSVFAPLLHFHHLGSPLARLELLFYLFLLILFSKSPRILRLQSHKSHATPATASLTVPSLPVR